MSPPIGVGIWVAYPQALPTISEVIDRCLQNGIKWLAVKSGDGAHPNTNFVKFSSNFQALHDKNIKIYTWDYNLPTVSPIAHLQRCFDLGADGHILDVEAEWNYKALTPLAVDLVKRLKEAFPEQFLGYTSFDYRTYHPNFPWMAFDKLGTVFPQIYWTEHNAAGALKHCQAVESIWENCPVKMSPVGVSYGHPTKWGKPPGQWNDMDLIDFIHYFSRYPSLSIYSFEAANPSFWSALNSLAPEIRRRWA